MANTLETPPRRRALGSTFNELRSRPAQTIPLVLAFAAMFASGPGQSFLIAVFVDEMLAGTALSRTRFSLLYAGGTVVSAIAMLALGRIADRFGLRVLWIAASAGLAGACFLAGASRGLVTVFFALALLRTFGQGSMPLVASLLVARSFRGRRGQAMASATVGITVASVALPPLAVALITELGWRDAYRMLGLALLVLVVPLAALVRVARDAGEPSATEDGRERPRYPQALRRRGAVPRVELPTRRMRRLLFVLAAPPLLITSVVFHAVSLLGERGLSFREAALALSLFGAASAVGTIATGVVSDRTTTRRLLTALAALMFAGLLALTAPSAVAAYTGFILVGLSGGVFGVVMGIVWPRTYGLVGIGRLQGTAWSVQIAGSALGPLPLAVSAALTGGYRPALVALTVYAFAALVVAMRWRDPRAVRLGIAGG